MATVWWHGKRVGFREIRHEPTHLWGRNNDLTMTYIRVGKKAAGRMLDGRKWSEMP
jgi:protein gp37